MQLTHTQYDLLERAVSEGRRIAVLRRGTEFIIIPIALALNGRREQILALHPTTGERLTIQIDEIDALEPVG